MKDLKRNGCSSYELIDTPVALFTLDGVMVDANPAFYRWTSVSTAARVSEAVPGLAAMDWRKQMVADGRLVVRGQIEGTHHGPRPVEYQLRPVEVEGSSLVLLEGRDMSRVVESELMLQSFTKLIDSNNRLLRHQKRALAELLDTMRQAVFAIDASGRIVAPVSRHGQVVFDRDIEGESVFDTVYAGLDPAGETLAIVRTTLNIVFGADELQWQLVRDNLPTRLELRRDGSDLSDQHRILKISYEPLWGDDECLEKIMLIVEDITEVERLHERIAEERQLNVRNLARLQELAAIERTLLESFFRESGTSIREALVCLTRIDDDTDRVHVLFRHIHTLKGNAKTMRLSGVTSLAHSAENDAAQLRTSVESGSAPDPTVSKQLRAKLGDIRLELAEYSRLAQRVLGVEDQVLRTAVSEIHECTADVDGFVASVMDASPQPEGSLPLVRRRAHTLKALARSLGEKPLAEAVATFEQALETASKANETHDQWSPVERSWAECLRTLLPVVFAPSSRAGISVEPDTWVPVIVGMVQLENSITAGHEPSLGVTHSLTAHCQAHELVSLASVFRIVEGLLGVQPCAVKTVSNLLDVVWRELALLTFLEASTATEETVRATWANMLRMAPTTTHGSGPQPSLPGCLGAAVSSMSAEQERSRSTIVHAMARALRIEPDAVAGRLLSMAPSGAEALQIETLLRTTGGHIDARVALDRLSLEHHGTTRIFRELVTLGEAAIPPYLVRLGMVQLLQAFRLRSSAQSAALPRLVSVMDAHLSGIATLLNGQHAPVVVGTDLERALVRLFDLPVGTIVGRLKHIVEDIAPTLGKRIMLVVKGAAMPIHRGLLPSLYDALLHMVRNAVDHGIETEAERRALGKRAEGTLELKFERHEREFRIVLEDDGRGIDVDAVVAKGIARGLVVPEAVPLMSAQERMNLIFVPGLTTADAVTHMSGRGVGMDVARASVEKLGGRLRVSSEFGKRATFTIEIPIGDHVSVSKLDSGARAA